MIDDYKDKIKMKKKKIFCWVVSFGFKGDEYLEMV